MCGLGFYNKYDAEFLTEITGEMKVQGKTAGD